MYILKCLRIDYVSGANTIFEYTKEEAKSEGERNNMLILTFFKTDI